MDQHLAAASQVVSETVDDFAPSEIVIDQESHQSSGASPRIMDGASQSSRGQTHADVVESRQSPSREAVEDLLPLPTPQPARTLASEALRTPQIDIAEISTSTGRTLRPRTYAQLHTYEYEHAKYVMECRAAGIQPVRFDGTRYRETDKSDRDYVPRPARPVNDMSGQVISSELQSEEINNNDTTGLSGLSDNESTLESGRKRKRASKVTRFKDPRKFDPSRQSILGSRETGEAVAAQAAGDNSFDFPDDHWQANFDQPPQSSPPRLVEAIDSHSDDTVAELNLISSGDETDSDSSKDDEAAAKALYARKLKGILPPSYLSRSTEVSKSRQLPPGPPRVNRGMMKSNIPHTGKGIAKKKFTMSRPDSSIQDLNLVDWDDDLPEIIGSSNDHLDSPMRQIVLSPSIHTSSMYDGYDIPEAEEAIDPMLPTPTRVGRKRKVQAQHPRARRRLEAPEVYLDDIVRNLPHTSVSRELRIANRTVKRKGTGGTHLSRKSLAFHDYKPTASRVNSERSEIGDEDDFDLERIVRQWEKNSLPFPTRPRKISKSYRSVQRRDTERAFESNRIAKYGGTPSSKASKRTKKLYQATLTDLNRFETSHVARDNNVRTGPLPLSPTSLGEHNAFAHTRSRASRGFFLDEEEDDDGDGDPSKRQPISRLPRTSEKHTSDLTANLLVTALGSRTYAGNLEHETGRYANARRTVVSRKPKTDYLQLFDQINNIFGAQEDHISKVSEWQRTELPKAVSERHLIEADPYSYRLHKNRKAERKRTAIRKTLRSTSILPFVQRAQNIRSPARPSSEFDFSQVVLDVAFGAEPVAPGVYFNHQTFLGSSGLARLLKLTDEGKVMRCYIDNKQLVIGHDHGITLQYGFDAIERSTDCLLDGQMISEDAMRSAYDFLRFSCSFGEPADNLYIIQKLAALIEKTSRSAVDSSQIGRFKLWLHTFALLHSYSFSRDHKASSGPQTDIFEEAMCRSIQLMLVIGCDTVSSAIRRQRNQINRVQGLSITFGDSSVEAWVIIVQLACMTQLGFWHRLNPFLELDEIVDQNISERAWRTVLQLSSITQFDSYGKSTERSLPNWPAVQILLEKVLRSYDPGQPHTLRHQDAYIRIVLRRVHKLIDHWKWPDCSVVLGQGRTGGVLYNFFVRDLNLGNLRSESVRKATLPAFFDNLDDPNCLSYSDVELENVFGIFLKLVCFGVKEFIDKLNASPTDLQRAKRRGIAVVDKFATHGRLNFSAAHSITQDTVNKVQNRFALEIAVYWTAGHWKDRGMSKVIHASREAMSGSHLILREINTNAWNRVIRLQVIRSEETSITESVLWLASVVQANVSDVLQFRYQARLNFGKPKLLKQTTSNLRTCLENLRQCYLAYFTILQEPLFTTTAKRLDLLWSNDLLKPVLQLQESFVLPDDDHLRMNQLTTTGEFSHARRSKSVVEVVLMIAKYLLEQGKKFAPEDDSEDYGAMDILSSQNGVEVVDHEQNLEQKGRTLTAYASTRSG